MNRQSVSRFMNECLRNKQATAKNLPSDGTVNNVMPFPGDSLALVEVVMEVEEEFDIAIPDESMVNMHEHATGELKEIVYQQLGV